MAMDEQVAEKGSRSGRGGRRVLPHDMATGAHAQALCSGLGQGWQQNDVAPVIVVRIEVQSKTGGVQSYMI
jgi:hypothetical protein